MGRCKWIARTETGRDSLCNENATTTRKVVRYGGAADPTYYEAELPVCEAHTAENDPTNLDSVWFGEPETFTMEVKETIN